MGLLSDALSQILEEVEKLEISPSDQAFSEALEYVENQSTDKKKGIQLILRIINLIQVTKNKQIEHLKIANENLKGPLSKHMKMIQQRLTEETKPFIEDKHKYYRRYQVFFSILTVTIFLLAFLLAWPLLNKSLLTPEISTHILYRVSILIPFGILITLLIYQFQNALKHYHKACESIHIMSSYPAIINAISLNKAQQEQATSRLLEILFDWQPRPNRWPTKKRKSSPKNEKETLTVIS